jgi:hypothetical protein
LLTRFGQMTMMLQRGLNKPIQDVAAGTLYRK